MQHKTSSRLGGFENHYITMIQPLHDYDTTTNKPIMKQLSTLRLIICLLFVLEKNMLFFLQYMDYMSTTKIKELLSASSIKVHIWL